MGRHVPTLHVRKRAADDLQIAGVPSRVAIRSEPSVPVTGPVSSPMWP